MLDCTNTNLLNFSLIITIKELAKIEKEILKYSIGGLLYMSAFQKKVVEKIQQQSIKNLTSVAFCLEDAIRDESLEAAENFLQGTLQELKNLSDEGEKLPLIFIRIRSPQHLKHYHEKIDSLSGILTGYIFPKFDLTNAEDYLKVVNELNDSRDKKIYIIPTFETENIADISTRKDNLCKLKKFLDDAKDFVLNIHVGANDFCNIYGLRRQINQTIYEIGVVRDILTDVLNTFAKDYVIAGSVWDYFGDTENFSWADGLKRELELDKMNGFIGKSAIHPAQLPYIFENMKVTKNDLDDANLLLNWTSKNLGVMKSADGSRMNEVKCHLKWAKKIKILSEIFGVKN